MDVIYGTILYALHTKKIFYLLNEEEGHHAEIMINNRVNVVWKYFENIIDFDKTKVQLRLDKRVLKMYDEKNEEVKSRVNRIDIYNDILDVLKNDTFTSYMVRRCYNNNYGLVMFGTT